MKTDSPENKKRSFLGTLIPVLSGSLAAQVLMVATAPILMRCYTPVDFGIFGVFVAFVAVGAIAVTLRFEMAIVVAKDDQHAQDLFWLAILCSGIATVILAPIAWFGTSALRSWPVVDEFGFESLAASVIWIPPALFINAFASTILRYASRLERFTAIGWAILASRGIDISIKLVIGIAFEASWAGLVFGFIIGGLVQASILTIACGLPKTSCLSRRLFRIAKEYADFPKFVLATAMLSSLTQNFSVTLLTFFFGAASGGLLESSRRILGQPISLLGTRFYAVFYQRSSQMLRDGEELRPFVTRIVLTVAAFTAPPFALVAISGPQLFAFAFGEEWRDAGTYAAILAPAWFLRSIASPVRLFNTVRKQWIALLWQSGTLVGAGSAIALGYSTGAAKHAIIYLSIALSTAYVIHLCITYSLAGVRQDPILATDST